MSDTIFDVVIVGGSYAGLAAGMALARALKQVLIIDDHQACNRQTPRSHNFLTNDGQDPAQITAIAKQQILLYKTVQFFDGTAVHVDKSENGFLIVTDSHKTFHARTIVFATGIRDLLPAVDGLADSWGISVLHCPYCHGYEVRDKTTGILSNGDIAFDFARLISNWTNKLTVFTNGQATLSKSQRSELSRHSIKIVEKTIARLQHDNGYVQRICFQDGSHSSIDVMYAPAPFQQHCKIPEDMGCELTAEGYIKTDGFHLTTIDGVYAIGDNVSKMRTVANAVASGTSAGLVISKKMILENF
jgi:thioredoxin reductase